MIQKIQYKKISIDNIEYFKNIAEKLKEKYTVNHFPCHIYNKAWFLIASRK